MKIQVRWITTAFAAICLIGLAVAQDTTTVTSDTTTAAPTTVLPSGSSADTNVHKHNNHEDEEIPSVKPLDASKKTTDKPGNDSDSKNDGKKKSIVDYSKPKPESAKKLGSKDVGPFETSTSKLTSIELPLLVRGEPLTTSEESTTTTTKQQREHTTPSSASSRARALNVTASEPGNTLHSNVTDLSDVSMDDEDKEVEGGEYIATHNATGSNVTLVNPLPTSTPVCVEGNETYAIGDKIKRGCEEQCLCTAGGKITNCEPMCQTPYFRAGRKSNDPFCSVTDLPDNPCCAILICSDSAPEPEETCVLGNNTIPRGERFNDGCSRVCVCEAAGHLKCQPRCPPNDTVSGVNQHDRCVVLQDPNDTCCSITLCDVTLGDHEIKAEAPSDLTVNLTDVKVLNSTAIKLKLSSKSPDETTIEISENNHVWRQVKPTKDGVISNLQPAHGYYVRVIEGQRAGPAIHVSLLAEVTKTSVTEKSEKGTCNHRGKSYKIGAEWHDECIAVCFCNETAQTECVTIQCPTDFGLDVLDPHCLDWETVPPNHVPKAPHCCPQEVRCRNNGSCIYEGKMYDNWSRLPTNITGCEKECFCEFGNITCNAACPPVPQHPPSNLNCKPHDAILTHLPGDECCLHWACPPATIGLPGKNMTTYPGPIDVTPKRPKDKSEATKPSLETTKTIPQNSDLLHYPMDPGHPTIPYIGPYNPDFKPTSPSVEELFHLPVEKAPPIKSKSKSESKKPVDSFKPHKDGLDQFPGPLAPDRFPEKLYPSTSTPTFRPNKLPGPGKDHPEQPQFIPLNEDTSDFAPTNGESLPTGHFDTLLENPAAGPVYGARPEDNAVPPKKKIPENYKPAGKRPDGAQNVPDDLYHLINLHPGLIQLDRGPPQGHPGLYDIHQEINGNEKRPVAPNYFGNGAQPPKKGGAHGKPQIFAQKDENGQTTYHVHAAEVPSTPQQLEELLAHIAHHDPNQNPYQQQHYPGGHQQHQQPGDLDPTRPVQSGVLPGHLGPHGFVPQVPPGPGQSGFEHGLPPPMGQFPGILGHGTSNVPTQQAYEISVEDLRAISGNTVRLMFTVPSVLVGLHGRVEVRYTSDKSNNDPSTWKSQTFAPPSDLIDTEDLEFDLSGLKPSTFYRLMIVVKLRDLSNTHTSKIYEVRTLDKQSVGSAATEISIDPELKILQVNATFAEFEWKKFTNYELQFIDGIYLMYKAQDEKTYSVTPLLHRSVNHYVLDHLRPLTTYEVHLSTKDIIGQANVLVDSKTVNFTTTGESDPYSFDVKVEIKTIKSTDVEVSWNGVPQPQDKYVNIYRAVYQSDTGKEDTSTFKIAKKDSPPKTIIGDLKPGTRYRLWIEVYLTNGKIKKSNVQDFVTKPGVLLPPGASQQQGKLASIPLHEGDYYGPLVIVAIVASLAILSTLILLMMLMKRRTSSKADISPRKTTSAYDNPSYKTCEESVPNGRRKTSEHEMATINGNNSNPKETP